MLAGTMQQLSHPATIDSTSAETVALPADDDLFDDSMPGPGAEWMEPEAPDGAMVPEGGDSLRPLRSWTPSMSTFRPLIPRERFTLVCPVTLTTQCWSKLRCPSEDGTPCNVTVHAKQQRKVHGYTDVTIVTMPRLRCAVHYSNAGRKGPCTFSLTDAKVWKQVEELQRKGEVIMSPRIVVISGKLLFTMDAYMCEPFSLDSFVSGFFVFAFFHRYVFWHRVRGSLPINFLHSAGIWGRCCCRTSIS
jgi:hypothetical protein